MTPGKISIYTYFLLRVLRLGRVTGKQLLQNNLLILMSHVTKPLGLVLSFLLHFVSLFLPSLDVTQTQIDFLFCCSGQHPRGDRHSSKRTFDVALPPLCLSV